MVLNVGDKCCAIIFNNVFYGEIRSFNSRTATYIIHAKKGLKLSSVFKNSIFSSIPSLSANQEQTVDYFNVSETLSVDAIYVFGNDLINDRNLLKILSYCIIVRHMAINGMVTANRVSPASVKYIFSDFNLQYLRPLTKSPNDYFSNQFLEELSRAFDIFEKDYLENKEFYKGGFKDDMPW